MPSIPVLAGALAVVGIVAAGCGTKGPLTLPAPKPAPPAPEAKLIPADSGKTLGGVAR